VEAARTPNGRDLASDRAQRIVDAMRESVAERGAAGSTFDRVARRAGVSRGLLHYYFGTKERLLVEVVRRDTELRLERLDAALANAQTAEDFIDVLVRSHNAMLRDDPQFVTLVFELFTAARRNDELAGEVAELTRRTREHLAALLREKQKAGVITLHDEPEAIAGALFALGDGLAMRFLLDPDADGRAMLNAGVACARALVT
jgi:AcrR family transcriptional regulator